MRNLIIAALLLLIACVSNVFAQSSGRYDPSTGIQLTGDAKTTTTFQGTMTVGAAASTSLVAANVTMASGTVFPGTFGKLTVFNTGSNPVYVCWFGGTASATSGCQLLAAGANDTVNMANFTTTPTFYSTAGTTIAFRN